MGLGKIEVARSALAELAAGQPRLREELEAKLAGADRESLEVGLVVTEAVVFFAFYIDSLWSQWCF